MGCAPEHRLGCQAGYAPEQGPWATCTSAPEQACAWHSCAGARHSCGTCLLRSSLCARRCAGAAISRTQQREGARARLAARSGRHMPHVHRCTSGPAARCTGAPQRTLCLFCFPHWPPPPPLQVRSDAQGGSCRGGGIDVDVVVSRPCHLPWPA